MVKRPMPCSVLQCSSWKQEVAKAKCCLAWSLEDRSKPRPNSPVLSPNTRRNAGGLLNETRSDGGALSLWTIKMVRERSSVVLKRKKLFRRRSSVSLNHDNGQQNEVLLVWDTPESETLLRFNIKSKSVCSCFDTEPLCGNNLRNMPERMVRKNAWLKEYAETLITIQT